MNLFLTFISYIGKDFRGNHIYDFIYCDSLDNIDGEDWDVYPAGGRPVAPNESLIKKVTRLESEIKLDLVMNDSIFSYWDAVDKIIAIAWENIDGYEVYPEHRLYFHYGDLESVVNEKVYEYDLVFKN